MGVNMTGEGVSITGISTGRKDIEYEDWHGHKLDRKMLTMLQKY